MPYELEIHSSFDFESAEYQELYAKSNATAFQSPLWLKHVYSDLVPQLDSEPIILTARERDSKKLMLVKPLLKRTYMGFSCVEMADLGVSDYNGAITDPELDEKVFLQEKTNKTLRKLLPSYDLISLRKMRAGSRAITSMIATAKVGEMETMSYDTPLSAPYEAWRTSSLSKSFRKELRRKQRKLEEYGAVRFELLQEEDRIRDAIILLAKMRSERFEDDLLKQDVYLQFYINIAIEGAKSGFAQTRLLYAGDEIAAVEFGIHHDRCYYFLLGGFDQETFAKCSPGMLMIDHILEQRAEAGDLLADFTLGDEAYKAKFNTTARPLKHIAISGNIIGHLVQMTYERGGLVKKVAKKLANLKMSA
ncbi:MAG: GNAT family N-acetyltransferase [Cohaesibacter sp.]|nr:GNAT family N-acetyltransferase [Cohaesibacter sp.]